MKAKIVLIGDSGVGKTSMINRLTKNEFTIDYTPTVGGNVANYVINTDKGTVHFGVWDTAGQEQYRSLVPLYFQGADAIVIVYDITERRSFNSLSEWTSLIRENLRPDILIALVGNKLDAQDKRAVSTDEPTKACNEHNLFVFEEVSAKTGQGIQDLLEVIATNEKFFKVISTKKNDDSNEAPVNMPPAPAPNTSTPQNTSNPQNSPAQTNSSPANKKSKKGQNDQEMADATCKCSIA
ncbi:GTP-binding protein YPT31/YPT8 [Tritrichomonas foetus]|uniref:GTP-binding protein YPT31/YPT8 n=1 Tax=Tritrichomonas foetus TaxID=1144522 RepID=A0A1J4J3B3_9EUKA|nr:GTP-binding protein YPT31/YPT8 [Tritrichomonas foetus]|eukprot:OHS93944.1 GTP-binding protein YPT31/YPT8 [Tritrichomonas foetus]